jgi:hypothetical protein
LGRKIEIELPDAGLKTTATLLDEDNKELCDFFWENLEQPYEVIPTHTMSTGLYVMGLGRFKHAEDIKEVKCKVKKMFPDLEPGDIVSKTGKDIGIAYGPITEPTGPFPIVAKANNIEEVKRIGMAIWEAQFLTKRPLKMIVRRVE